MNVEISQQTTDQIAAIIGTSDEAVISEIIENVAKDEQLLKSLVSHAASPAEPPSEDTDEWLRRLYAIGTSHPATGYSVDDSRESIYPDRS